MKLVMIGASIIALTALNTAIANPRFNQTTHSQPTVQFIADQNNTTDAMNPAPETTATDQNTNTENPDQTQPDQNSTTQSYSGGTTTDQPPAVSIPAAPAEHPVPNQPDSKNPNSQNSY